MIVRESREVGMSLKRQCKTTKGLAAVLLAFSLWGIALHFVAAADTQQNLQSFEIISAALEQGLDVNRIETDGTTLLMRAIHNRNTDLARLLIESGADISLTNRYGMAPLILAVRRNNLEITTLLLAYGADANTLSVEGESVLMSASKTGNVELIKILLAGNAEHYSPNGELILTSKADPNIIEGWKGQTAIMWAAAYGHAETIRLLIEAGADIDQPSFVVNVAPVARDWLQGGFVYTAIPKGRMTALHFAAREGKLESIRALIEAGADLNLVDDDKSSALILAIFNGHLDVAGALLDAGADPDISDRWGRTALFVATDLNTLDANPWPAPKKTDKLTAVDIVKKILDNDADPDPLLKSGLPNWVQVGGAHNPILDEGATPFFRAAMSGDLEIINLLLQAGADASLPTAEREGFTDQNAYFIPSNGDTTPFQVAAGVSWRPSLSRGREADAIATLTLLLEEHEADINVANQFGTTALHGAVVRGSAAIVSYLVEHGASMTAEDSRELTPLDIALGQPQLAIDPNKPIAELLRQYMVEDILNK